MVRYSIDVDPRPKIYFCIAILTLLISIGLGTFLQSVSGKVLAPSAFAVFCILVTLFDRFLWKFWPFSLVCGVPNISGAYEGWVERFDDSTGKLKRNPVKATISQTWSMIEVAFEGEKTVSNIRTCGMFVSDSNRIFLIYTYLVKNKKLSPNENIYGEGTQELRLISGNKNKLVGAYYSTKFRGGSTELVEVTD